MVHKKWDLRRKEFESADRWEELPNLIFNWISAAQRIKVWVTKYISWCSNVPPRFYKPDMKIRPLGSSGIILTCYRFLTSMCHFLAKTQHKTIDKPKNFWKQWILIFISFHFSQIQAFECKIGPFLDLFAQKNLISDQSARKSDH